MWSFDELARLACSAVGVHDRACAASQAVRGVDMLDEVGLHPVLASGFEAGGFGVLREMHFPGPTGSRAKDPERERCDLVLTQTPGVKLRDPVHRGRSTDRAEGTLFAPVAERVEDAAERGRVPPEEACWLEVKTVGQFATIDGVGSANGSYAAQLRACSRDLRKLSKDQRIVHGALVLVLFGAEPEVGAHDLDRFVHHCVDRGVPLGAPSVEWVAITDRIGNAWACVAVVPAGRDYDGSISGD